MFKLVLKRPFELQIFMVSPQLKNSNKTFDSTGLKFEFVTTNFSYKKNFQ